MQEHAGTRNFGNGTAIVAAVGMRTFDLALALLLMDNITGVQA